MYGTVARLRVKSGMEAEFKTAIATLESEPVAGFIGSYIYQLDSDPRDFFMSVLFESKAEYVANANSPEQHQRYLKMIEYLEAAPEWHDGAAFFASPSQ